MLDSFSRGAVVGMSALCVIGALTLAPTRARSSNDTSVALPSSDAAAAAARSAGTVAIVEVRRDPFLVIASPHATAAAATPVAATHDPIAPLPGNLVAGAIPAIPSDAPAGPSAARITAIVTGAHPYAMVDTAGIHEIKGIGDRVGGSPIVGIDITGVTLQSGERLTVGPGDAFR